MTVVVYGAGAIGGITGAALTRAGHDVLLVDREETHVAAMNAGGLHVEAGPRSWSARVKAVTPAQLPAATGGRDLMLVLLAVKSQHTADALLELAPRLAADGAIVSLQNGLNEELIAKVVGRERTVACLVNWGADWLAPGRIMWGGEGAFVVGELDGPVTPRIERLAALLAAAAPARTSDNVVGLKWSKHVYGSLLFATALVDETVFDVVERSPAIQHMLVALVAEGIAVADAAGVRLEAFDEFDPAWYRAAAAGDAAARERAMAAIAMHYRAHAKNKTGVWRDLAVRKRKTEVDALIGTTLAKGRALGQRMALTDELIRLIHEVEDGRPMSWANLDRLVGAAGAA
ncbi:MAG: 2-dehydropantoate 2-reductase [Candidatus Rokubacteria bacterium]|nr:2-dehydropantoate 2-reductase [Candidatus Rokubacteria bacterium]